MTPSTRSGVTVSRFQLRTDDGAPARPGYAVLDASGELDLATAPELIELAISCLDAESTQVLVVDLSAVTFMDSTALGALISIRESAEQAGKQLQLSAIPDRVRRLFEITGMTDVFSIADDDLPDAVDGAADIA
jgi:anti-sigma B factor antagonist